jgi:diguanylate cyclase (GGDEF)-like protein
MLVVASAMALNVGAVWCLAAPILRSRRRFTLQVGAILTQIAAMSCLVYLDGGVTAPLGAVAVYWMLFFGATLPSRVFAIVCGATGVAYWTVALLGPSAPPGYAEVMTLGTGGVAYLCHRYANALRMLRRRLADVSRTDPLTGCLNRRGFDERLAEELAQAERTGQSLALVLADLDRFKDVNDRYGHHVGDDLLAWTGRTLQAQVRAHDAVGRLGGDEFAAVLSDTDPDGAEVVVRRIRESMRDSAPGSFGIAAYPADGATADELMRVADQRLYQDKEARDRQAGGAAAIAAARSTGGGFTHERISRYERRRRTIRDLGVTGSACFLIGITYALFLATGRANRAEIALLLCVGGAFGLTAILAAGPMSRRKTARQIMTAISIPQFVTAAAAVMLDGGVMSPISLGLLAPLPLVAFGTPVRQAMPIIGAVLGAYVSIGVVVGGASAWYVGMHAGGSLFLAVICGWLGRNAAGQRQLLTRLSRIDVLTECLNRRGFEERFTAELAHAQRGSGALTLLILDLDRFKQLNDSRGHAAGDELLRWVGATLHAELHPHDVVGRLGGDEFVVLLTDWAERPREVAHRLREALGERTQVSVGMATLGRDGTDFDSLYAHADAELYAEKRGRRTAPTQRTPAGPLRPDRAPAGPAREDAA